MVSPLSGFDASALRVIMTHPRPGNVRELDYAMERAVLMARGTELEAADLGLATPLPSAQQSFDDLSLEAVETILIQKALARVSGNVSHAEALGLCRGALCRCMDKYNLYVRPCPP